MASASPSGGSAAAGGAATATAPLSHYTGEKSALLRVLTKYVKERMPGGLGEVLSYSRKIREGDKDAVFHLARTIDLLSASEGRDKLLELAGTLPYAVSTSRKQDLARIFVLFDELMRGQSINFRERWQDICDKLYVAPGTYKDNSKLYKALRKKVDFELIYEMNELVVAKEREKDEALLEVDGRHGLAAARFQKALRDKEESLRKADLERARSELREAATSEKLAAAEAKLVTVETRLVEAEGNATAQKARADELVLALADSAETLVKLGEAERKLAAANAEIAKLNRKLRILAEEIHRLRAEPSMRAPSPLVSPKGKGTAFHTPMAFAGGAPAPMASPRGVAAPPAIPGVSPRGTGTVLATITSPRGGMALRVSPMATAAVPPPAPAPEPLAAPALAAIRAAEGEASGTPPRHPGGVGVPRPSPMTLFTSAASAAAAAAASRVADAAKRTFGAGGT